MPANCAEIGKVTSGGRNWILLDLESPEAKAFDRKYSSCIRLWNTIMKKWFHHHLENFISFPLIYRFAGIRRVLTELEAENLKHHSNYTVTLRVPRSTDWASREKYRRWLTWHSVTQLVGVLRNLVVREFLQF